MEAQREEMEELEARIGSMGETKKEFDEQIEL